MMEVLLHRKKLHLLHGILLDRYGAFNVHANKPYICFLLLQEEYFITHHCFIVPGAIYAVCCKTQDLFESGVSTLLPWLAMIKVIEKTLEKLII